MASVVRGLRADEAEFALWQALAARLGLPFNRWARRALNDQLELDESLLREREGVLVDERSGDGGRDG